MPLFGAHMSVAGGLHLALIRAKEQDSETVQLFTKNANQWKTREITPEEIELFRQTLRATGLQYATAHDSYLINLASPDETLYRRSIEAFLIELNRAEQLQLSYLVMHPGAHVGSGEEAGLARVAAALDEIHTRCPNYRVKILIETTAGQGSTLGYRFEHLGWLFANVAAPERLGVCFDTCHVFAAGYPLAALADYQATMQAFDQIVGLKRLCLFHMNDSLREQGSRVDRHAHIGRGCIGQEAFRHLVNDPRFSDRPMILETPKEDGDEKEMDAVNLRLLRGLLADA